MIFRLPQWSPPSQVYDVAVLDQEKYGLADFRYFGWIDDSFVGGWSSENVDIKTDGEVLTFNWQFHTGDYGKSEPSLERNISSVDTNRYPYIVVRYKNTGTSLTAFNNVGQIITIVNQTGYPGGFVKNIFLPVSGDSGYSHRQQPYTVRAP